MLQRVAEQIMGVKRNHPVRVAVDGIDAAGKSIFADELSSRLNAMGKRTILSSVDYFHNPLEIRHKRGNDSPLGYYEDSFDYKAIISSLLEPLGPGGSRFYRKAIYDFTIEAPVKSEWLMAKGDEIFIFEGIFLLRPELLPYWDLKIFLDIDFETSVERASQRERDLELFGEVDAITARYRKRYVPGQKIYFQRCHPHESADILVDHHDLFDPKILIQKDVL
jgi:uridine kinase